MSSEVEHRFEEVSKRLKQHGTTLFDYQEEGVKWMLEHELNPNNQFPAYGGLLCDDPGLGKTLQTIALMLANPVKITLIVCPISLMEQWRNAIRVVWPEAKIRLNHSGGLIEDDKELRFVHDTCDIVISGYSRVWSTDDFQEYHKTPLHLMTWDRIVLDECHIIRNRKSKIFQGCHDLKAKYRWGLSGTPLQNKLEDLKTLFRYMHVSDQLIINELPNLIDCFIKRRNKTLVAEKYKELTINIVNIPFETQEERDFYIMVQEEVKKEFLRLKYEEDQSSIMMEIFELLLRLRQATIHPNLVIKGLAKKVGITKPKLWKKPSSKINKMLELFANHEPEDRALVVCHFTEEIDQARLYLGRAFPKLRLEVFNGGLSVEARNEIVARSMRGEIDVLFMQIMAGGVGLNLQVFNKVYLMTPNWNPGNEIQAFARCHRIGQTRNVEVNKIIVDDEELKGNTIDIRIVEKQIEKRQLMAEYLSDETFLFNEDYLNKKNSCGNNLTMKDMEKLIMG